MNKKLVFLFLIVVIVAAALYVFLQTKKDTSISEPPQTPKRFMNVPFIVEPMQTENVRVIHAGYSNSNWSGMEPNPNAYKPPAKGHYFLTFRINRKTTFEPIKIWVKNEHTIPLEIEKDGYLVRDPSNKEVDVTISGTILTTDKNYTTPPQNFEGEALVEVLINGEKKYFVVKMFERKMPP